MRDEKSELFNKGCNYFFVMGEGFGGNCDVLIGSDIDMFVVNEFQWVPEAFCIDSVGAGLNCLGSLLSVGVSGVVADSSVEFVYVRGLWGKWCGEWRLRRGELTFCLEEVAVWQWV